LWALPRMKSMTLRSRNRPIADSVTPCDSPNLRASARMGGSFQRRLSRIIDLQLGSSESRLVLHTDFALGKLVVEVVPKIFILLRHTCLVDHQSPTASADLARLLRVFKPNENLFAFLGSIFRSNRSSCQWGIELTDRFYCDPRWRTWNCT